MHQNSQTHSAIYLISNVNLIMPHIPEFGILLVHAVTLWMRDLFFCSQQNIPIFSQSVVNYNNGSCNVEFQGKLGWGILFKTNTSKAHVNPNKNMSG